MKKICVSSSYDDRETMIEVVNGLLSANECVVLYPQFLGCRPTPEEKISLMQSHFYKMSVSDYFVFIFMTKFGVNTLMELGYALNISKRKRIIALLSKDLDPPDELTCGVVRLSYKISDTIEYLNSAW